MRIPTLLLAATALLCAPGQAQVVEEIRAEYNRRVWAAEQPEATSGERVAAARAARFLRLFDEARDYLASAAATTETEGDRNDVLRERLWLELATGGGVEGVQRVFREEVDPDTRPTVVAGWIGGFPELLVGGEFDALIDRLSEDAEDPLYRCACDGPKAWRYRVAGDMERSRMHWKRLTDRWDHNREFADPYDEAEWRAQYARNLARAGDADHARQELERAMSVDLDVLGSVSIRRRRAQTYAELGEVEKAIEDLDYLLTNPSSVTVHTLESRMAWALVRDHPAFQALLERHAGR